MTHTPLNPYDTPAPPCEPLDASAPWFAVEITRYSVLVRLGALELILERLPSVC